MEKWIRPGPFSLALPDNWSVAQLDMYTEFTPQSDDAAIHVSPFLKEACCGPSKDEATKVVENFARQNRLKAKSELTYLSTEREPIALDIIAAKRMRHRNCNGCLRVLMGSPPRQWLRWV